MSTQRLTDRRMLLSINMMFDNSRFAHIILAHRQCVTKFLDQATQLLFVCRRKAIIRSTNQFTGAFLLPLLFRRRGNRRHDIHRLKFRRCRTFIQSNCHVMKVHNPQTNNFRSWRNQHPRRLHTFDGYLSSLAHPRFSPSTEVKLQVGSTTMVGTSNSLRGGRVTGSCNTSLRQCARFLSFISRYT